MCGRGSASTGDGGRGSRDGVNSAAAIMAILRDVCAGARRRDVMATAIRSGEEFGKRHVGGAEPPHAARARGRATASAMSGDLFIELSRVSSAFL